MKRLSILSVVFITAGTAAGPALAQATVGGQQISEDQMGRVEGYCRALEAGSTATGPFPQTDGLNLRTISLADCREAGLLEDTAAASTGEAVPGNTPN